MAMRNGSGVTIRKAGDFHKALEAALLLADVEVLVGFPEESTERREDLGETLDGGKAHLGGKSEITNAALGYIHDNGAPEQNIPARPFMLPGINDAEEKLTNKLGQVVRRAVLDGGGPLVVEVGMTQVGLIAKLAIQNKINEGIPPPLSDRTLIARAKKGRRGAGLELLSRNKGIAPATDFAKPLVDTGQMRNAVNYAIRSRRKRK